MTAIALNLNSVIRLTDEQFHQVCQENPDIRLERTSTGELIVMPPTGWATTSRNKADSPYLNSLLSARDVGVVEGCPLYYRNDLGGTGNSNIKLSQRLANWTDADGTGIAFDSSTGFKLPNGAERSPDAAWVRLERLNALNPDPRKFLPLAPDFAVELRSASDNLKRLQEKMQEYLENGVRLGWLINSVDQQVEIYC